MQEVARDFIQALRRLVKQPGTAFAVLVTLGAAIGVNTAIFSAFNNVVLRSLPFDKGDTLVVLSQHQRAKGTTVPFSVSEVTDYRSQMRSVEKVSEYHTMSFTLLGGESARRVSTGVVSHNFFDLLQIKPIIGRAFLPSDEGMSAEPVVLLSYEFWQSRFGGDEGILNNFLDMNDKQHRIIGVLPKYSQFPDTNEVYMPTSACPFRSSERTINTRDVRMLKLLARLREGSSLQQANAEAMSISARMQQDHSINYPPAFGYATTVDSVREEMVRDSKPIFYVLLGATLLVLVLACANVGSLLLTQQVQRRKELTVRAAVGATPARILRMLMTETMTLALIGGGLGLLLALGTLGTLSAFAAGFTQRAGEIQVDFVVLLFTFAVSVAVGVAVGLLPVVSKTSIVTGLRESSDKSTAPEHKQKVRKALVAGQVAITVVLLVASGLMVRNIMNLQNADLGFEPNGVTAAQMDLNWSKYGSVDAQRDFARRIERSIRQVPGVSSVAVATSFPLDGTVESNPFDQIDVAHQDRSVEDSAAHAKAVLRRVGAGYFDTLRVKLLAGRIFTAKDDEHGERVAIVNRKMVATHWSDGAALGKYISVDKGQNWLKIVGIVEDEKRYALSEDAKPQVYVPFLQSPALRLNILLAAASGTPNLERHIRTAVSAMDRDQAVTRIDSLSKLLEDSISSSKIMTTLLIVFACAALTITLAGLAGVIAYSVTLRTREIGIRVAIGAEPRFITWMIVRQGLLLTCVGLAAGLLLSIVVGNLLASRLYKMAAFDPSMTFLVVAIVLVASFLACWVPARRASHINPRDAIRAL